MEKFIYEVCLDNIPITLTYIYNQKLNVGDVVFVTVSNREILGIIWKILNETQQDRIRSIMRITNINIGKNLLLYIEKISQYTLYNRNIFIKSIIPKFSGRNKLDVHKEKKIKKPLKNKKKSLIENLEEKEKINEENFHNNPQNSFIILKEMFLNNEQKNIVDIINKNNTYTTFLLYGTTGSGKTEVSIAAIIKTISENKQVLILLPEIGLINQWVERINKYIQCEIITYHSLKSKSKTVWEKIINNNNLIVIGARSAIFLPFKSLGLIIVDEEHDSSYKQDTKPIYNGRDAAVMRGYYENCPVILASATPSLESLRNVQLNKYQMLKMVNKFHTNSQTEIIFMPMYNGIANNNITKTENNQDNITNKILSDQILREIKGTYLEGKKTIIFVNRRGYGKKVICTSCHSVIQCKFCDYCLVYHKFNNKYLCHLCNYEKTDNVCNECKKSNCLKSYGIGVETVEEFIHKNLPQFETIIFSSDTTSSNKELTEKIQEINNDKPSIIIGTQMLSKGHDLHNLKLVILLDLNISNTDFRGREKALQLLTQILGRVGRREGKYKAIIQMDLNSPFSLFLQKNFIYGEKIDYVGLLQQEISEREQWKLPPFVDVINIYIQHKKKETAEYEANNVFEHINGTVNNIKIPYSIIKVSLPVTMPIARKNAMWRYVLSITLEKKQHIGFLQFLKKIKIKGELIIDVNPIFKL